MSDVCSVGWGEEAEESDMAASKLPNRRMA